jgi:hypothetical protein
MANGRKGMVNRALHFNSPRMKRQVQTKQLVVTLGVSRGDVKKLETLDTHGKRHDVSDDEITTLANLFEVDETRIVLEEAYAAGVADAIKEITCDPHGDASEILRQAVARRVARFQFLRRHVRRLIVHRLICRELDYRRAHPEIESGSSERP